MKDLYKLNFSNYESYYCLCNSPHFWQWNASRCLITPVKSLTFPDEMPLSHAKRNSGQSSDENNVQYALE